MVRFVTITLGREERECLAAIKQRHEANPDKAQAPTTERSKVICARLLNYGMLDEVHGIGGRVGYVPASFPVIEGRVNR